MSNLIGQSLGRYHILEQLGEGGMATVYKAYDTRLECDVAVKVIRTEKFMPEVLARAPKRFEREAKALARLTHPNIVKVTDYGEYEGRPYLVMPYLPGGNLKGLLKERGRLNWQEAARTLIPVARALEYAHSQGVIHRDVKPSNILITQSGEYMLTDFGVAKVLEEEATVDLTGTAAAVGTPEYMAPEQASAKTADQRADIYALGIVFYEMLTGRRPFEADTPLGVIIKQASEPLPRPRQFVPDLPDRAEQILLKALAKKPEDRYQNMGLLAYALEGLANGNRVQEAVGKQPREESRQQGTVQRKQEPALSPSAPPQSTIRNRQFNMPWLIGLGLAAVSLLIGWLVGGGPAALFPTRMPASPSVATESVNLALTPTSSVTPIAPTSTAIPTKTPLPTPTTQPVLKLALDTPIGLNKEFIIHRIAEGESLDRLASKYGTTVALIQAVNYYLPSPLVINLTTIIPLGRIDLQGVPAFQPYMVVAGMTVDEFAQGISVDVSTLSYLFSATLRKGFASDGFFGPKNRQLAQFCMRQVEKHVGIPAILGQNLLEWRKKWLSEPQNRGSGK